MKIKISLIFILLFLGVLSFDFWVYKNFILGAESRVKENEPKEIFLLKTPLLEKVAEEIKKRDDFLKSPKYLLIKNPF